VHNSEEKTVKTKENGVAKALKTELEEKDQARENGDDSVAKKDTTKLDKAQSLVPLTTMSEECKEVE